MRWLLLIVILLFICVQIVRMRPSKRDQQLEGLRKSATRAGLAVRFWTLSKSGFTHRELPESGFVYLLPWPAERGHEVGQWAVWLSSRGDVVTIAGAVPDLAKQWLASFSSNFSDAWGLLQCNNSGIGLLWQERGSPEDVQKIADALEILRKNLDALPG